MKAKKKSHPKPAARPAPPEPPKAKEPRLGVVVCSSDPWDAPHVSGVLQGLETGARLSGAAPVRFLISGLPAASDGFPALPWRDLAADQMECLAQAAHWDGLVLAADDNPSASGLLMAAARLNLPAVFAPLRGSFNDQEAAGPSPNRRDDYQGHAVACLSETLGLCLPGASTAPTGSAEHLGLARQSAQRAVELVRQGFGVRRVLLPNAFLNAFRMDAALGGWPGAVVFLTALAQECGVKLSLEALADIGLRTPQICHLSGADGQGLRDLHQEGGLAAVLAAFKGQWLPHPTVSGRSLTDLSKAVRVREHRVLKVRPPVRKSGPLMILRGNLAPQGALLRLPPRFPDKLSVFSGPAKVYDSREAALQALRAEKIVKGDVLVVRYEGPKGGPGLRPLTDVGRALEEQGLSQSVAAVTDGSWGDWSGGGLAVELASPEATEGSALSIIKEGDRVDIDLGLLRLNVRLTEMEIKVRLARWQAPPPRTRAGFLARYARAVASAWEGAVLK